MKRIIIFLLLALSPAAYRTYALQSEQPQNTKAPIPTPRPAPGHPLAELRRDFKNSMPLAAGERLEYEIKFSRFPIYATVGVITFEFLGAANRPESLIPGLNIEYVPPPDEQFLHLRATATSKGMLIALLGVDIKGRFESLVNADDFSARLTFREMKEGKKHEAQSAVFDQPGRQVKYLTTNQANPQAPPKAKFLKLEDGMMSLLPAVYFLRLQKYKEGQLISFPASYDEENYQFEILVGKKEKLKTDCGKVKTVKLEPKLFGPGRLISRPGEMFMWVTDDSRHTPLRLIAKTSQGTVTARLLNFKNNCRIEDPEETEKPKEKN